MDVRDANIFMVMREQNLATPCELPPGYRFRRIKPNEIGVWKRMQFDDDETALRLSPYLDEWFKRVYAPKRELFYERVWFVRDRGERPVATCFVWEAYGTLASVHWFKVIKKYEGLGIGRALLAKALGENKKYPVYLHTQPGSFRAIKLYSDFGFKLIRGELPGPRPNGLEEGLPYLKEAMPEKFYAGLKFEDASDEFKSLLSCRDSIEF